MQSNQPNQSSKQHSNNLSLSEKRDIFNTIFEMGDSVEVNVSRSSTAEMNEIMKSPGGSGSKSPSGRIIPGTRPEGSGRGLSPSRQRQRQPFNQVQTRVRRRMKDNAHHSFDNDNNEPSGNNNFRPQANLVEGVLDIMEVTVDPAREIWDPRGAQLEPKTLFQLAQSGDTKGMEAVLETIGTPKSPRVVRQLNTLDDKKTAVLHYAARYEALGIVKLIVKWGGDVNIRGDDGLTPLHFAARFKIFKPVTTFTSKSYNGGNGNNNNKANGDPDLDIGNILSGNPPGYDQSEGENDGSVILFLATSGADVNARDKYGLTPLHYSAMRGNDDAANDLLQLPETNLEAQDEQKLTPLHLACTYGWTNVAKILLEHGANIRGYGEMHQTALHKAAAVGVYDLVRMLTLATVQVYGKEEVKRLAHDVDNDQNTPLLLAVEGGSAEITEHLILECGSNVNHFNNLRVYPLHLACTNGSIDIVRILVKNGATINVVNSNQQTPLAVAAAFGNVAIIEYLLKKGARINNKDNDGFTPLLLAAAEGHEAAVDILLRSGADIFSMDREDKTALSWAAMQNHQHVVKVLMRDKRAGKLISVCDRYDNSPLHVACERGYLDIVFELLDSGADVDNKNEDEQTPLHFAAKHGRVKIVREILKRDIYAVNDEDFESNTALHLACIHGHNRVVSELIASGADIASRNYFLWTPLDCAAAYGHPKCAKLLLDANADIDPTDKNKTTPLHLTARYGHEKTAKLLIDHGASVCKPNSSGYNALTISIQHGKREVAEVIIESDVWLEALKSEFISPVTGIKDTPLRLLIKVFPELAKRVFDRCMQTNLKSKVSTVANGKKVQTTVSADDPTFAITFNFELLDDSYTLFRAKVGDKENFFQKKLDNLIAADETREPMPWHNTNIFEDNNKLIPEAEPYTGSSSVLKLNHPLMIMVKEQRVNLLGHPLCMALVRHKWNSFGRYVYYSTLIMFVAFVVFLTEFLVNTPAPYSASQMLEFYEKPVNDNGTTLAALKEAILKSSDTSDNCAKIREIVAIEKRSFATIGQICIIGLAAFHLLKELFQLTQARLTYFGVENLIEWTCYVTAILFVIDFNECQRTSGIRYGWQWQVGAVSVTMSWLNLLSNVRKFPFLGIYVVMFTDVVQTFLKFSIICGMFIIAFSLGFHALFIEQDNFSNIGFSMVKTAVMMIGEFEFDDLFFDNPRDDWSKLPYRTFTMLFFLGFMIVMPIIIMNLLVGLAVDDIKTVQDNAVLSRLAMQVTLNLDVERMLPDFIRRKFITREQTILPNQRESSLIKRALRDGIALARITKGVVADNDQSEMSQLSSRLDEVLGKMKGFKDQMKQVSQELDSTKSLLQAMAKKSGIDFVEEDS